MHHKLKLCVAILILISVKLNAQQVAIGHWQNYVGLSDVVTLADADDRVFCATNLGLFSVDKT
ncbi:MAG: hypothetical protein RIQ33_1469, partial [Bacteroidota bacterium]